MPIDDAQLAVALRPDIDVWHSPGTWAWNSYAIATVGERELLVFAEMRADSVDVYVTAESMADAEILEGFSGREIALRARPISAADWSVTAVLGDNRLGLWFGATLSKLTLPADKPRAGKYLRILFNGIKMPEYTHSRWMKADAESRRTFGYTFMSIFGRDVIVADAGEGEHAEECFVGLTLPVPDFSQLELDAVEMVLYMLAGVGGIRRCVEVVDQNGRQVSMHMHRVGHAAFRDVKPIFPREEYKKPDFYGAVSQLCDNAKALIEKGVPLRALLFHIFSSQQMVPEIAITHLAIALDGFNTAVVEKIKGEGNLLDPRAFKQRINPVLEAAKNEFSAPEEAGILNYILERIRNSNNWSINKRWERFWGEYVRYDLTEKEQEVLELRGSAIHSAYILLTEYDLALKPDGSIDRRPYEDRLRDLAFDAGVYRNVVNRVLLVLLGYRGPFVDFTNWRNPLEA